MRAALLVIAACRARAPGELVASGPSPVAAETLAAADGPARREHGWQLWAALDAPTAHGHVWETWPSSDAVLGVRERHLRALRSFKDGEAVIAEQLPLMFAVAFDPIAAAFVRDHRLASRAELARLRATGLAMPELPRGAIAIKSVWYAIAARGLTAMPVWDGGGADDHGNPDRAWPRIVAVDPSRDAVPVDETAEVELDGRRVTAHVVPLAAFIHHSMAPAELAAAARVARVEPGASIALVAMHVTTKELPDWVWATFWWHDRPTVGPFAAGRPVSLVGPASHYLMDVAYAAGTPCFNPYLEARFPRGQHSNCLTCHQRAVFGVDDYLPVTQGRLTADDPYFANRLPTDFVWTLALEAH